MNSADHCAFNVLEDVGDASESLEIQILFQPSNSDLSRIHQHTVCEY